MNGWNVQATASVGRILRIGAAAAILGMLGSPAIAQEEPATTASGSTMVNEFFGTMGTEAPIAVPRYRGLEPKLSIRYSSQSGDGLLGIGWSLSGFSTITRADSRLGMPIYFQTNDVFMLDGAKVIPCQAGSSSPSCTSGGNHTTEIESYVKIKRVWTTSVNEWHVWRKDGTLSIFRPILAARSWDDGSGNHFYQWGLQEVRDTRGNIVNYDWQTSAPSSNIFEHTWARPQRVRYNGNTITLHYEAYVHSSVAIGGGHMVQPNGLLRTIEVRVGTALARAYALSYSATNLSLRRHLQRIQQYGTDATISSGIVTGGSSLPPMQMSYYPEIGTQYTQMTADSGCGDLARRLVGDFNGDGRSDLLCQARITSNSVGVALGARAYVRFGQANGSLGPVLGGTEIFPSSILGIPVMTLGDWDGDGKTDFHAQYLVATSGSTRTYRVQHFRSQADGTFGAYGAATSYQTAGNDPRLSTFAMDLDGDGRDTIVYYRKTGSYPGSVSTSPVDNTGLLISGNWCAKETIGTNNVVLYPSLQVSDFNGDGRSDLLCVHGNNLGAKVAISNGATLVPNYSFSWPGWRNASTLLGDFNGDGFTDIANFNKSSQILTVALSTGDTSDRFAATSYQTSIGPPGTCTAADDILYTGNYNGDSHTDLICRNQNTGALKLALGFGNGQMRPQTVSSGAWCAAYYDFGTADFNGDGRSDLYCTPRAYTAGTVYTARNVDVNGASQAGLLGLRTISNGIGGSSTIVYRSSSDIANTYLPIGMVSQVVAQTTNNDGRGNVATINYSYSGGLFSNLERRFLGFRRVTSTYDAAGNYNETYYFQRAGSSSKPETSYRRSPSGAIWHYNHHVYCEDGKRSDNNAACGVGDTAAPFTSVLIERWEYQCNLSSSCRRTLQQFGYDSYANATAVYEHGDYDVAGDERTTVRGFTPNPGAYIVASPAYENVYRGIGTAGTLVQQTFFHYDNATAHTTAPVRGDLTEKRHLKDNGTFATTRYAYDAKGNLTRSTNPLNQSTTIAYDATYGVYDVRSTDALGRASTKTWDYVRGQISSQTDVNASPVSYTHDAFGRPVQRTNPDGGTVRYSYLNWGSPTTQRIVETAADGSADGLWTETYFDGMNRPWMTVREKAPSARIQITNYDGASDRIKSRSLWHFAGSTPLYVQYAYDGTGRETSVRYPDGVQVRSIYAPGRVDRYDENNNRKASFFDGLGRLTRVDEYNGAAVSTSRYEYDVRNNLTRFVDAAGRATTSTWDRLGRKLQFCEPSSGCSAYTYDDAGQMLTARNARSQTISYAYDATGRRTSEVKPDGTVTYRYDEAGRGPSLGQIPTTVLYPGGEQRRTLNWAGQVVSESYCVDGTCETFGWTYDTLRRVRSLTYPDGERVDYGYDSAGSLVTVGGYVTKIVYAPHGQMYQINLANGTSQSFGYSETRQLLTSTFVSANASNIFSEIYAYDAAARLTSVSASNDPMRQMSFGYDRLNRLTSVSGGQTQTFTYDAIGNITSNSRVGAYTYDASKHQAVRTAGPNSYTYDADGNMLTGAGRTMTWSADSRLLSVSAGGNSFSVRYDHEGNRIRMQGPGSNVTRFSGRLADRTNGGALIKHISAGGMPIGYRVGMGNKYYYHTDRLGSVAMITDQNKVVQKRTAYRPFGEAVVTSGGTLPDVASNRRGYTGHDHLWSAGLVYMNARWYDPAIGRFLSPDTLVPDPANPQSFNRYSYVLNNPFAYTDPSGHHAVAIAVAFVVANAATIAQVAVIAGMATSMAGHALENKALMMTGALLSGIGGGYGMPGAFGGIGGAFVGGLQAGLTSPLSPLDANTRQAIGWAYTAYGLAVGLGFNNAEPDVDGAFGAVKDSMNKDIGPMREYYAFQFEKKYLNIDPAELAKHKAALDGWLGDKSAVLRAATAFEKATGFNHQAVMNYALVEHMGMVGPGASWLTTVLHNSVGQLAPVYNHGLYHDVFGAIYTNTGWGFGYNYATGGVNVFSNGLSNSGQVEGIIRRSWENGAFNHAAFNMVTGN